MPSSRDAAGFDSSHGRQSGGPPDDDLLKPDDAARRDFSAFGETMMGELLAFAVPRVGDSSAGDVVNETLLVAWKNWDGFPSDQDGRRRQVYGILKNKIREHERSVQRHERRVFRAMLTHPRDPIERPETTVLSDTEVARLLARLSPPLAEAARLGILQGSSTAQVARSLGISESAASTRLARARRQLQTILEEERGDTDA